jgi:tyrosine-protein phosphatase SIW14
VRGRAYSAMTCAITPPLNFAHVGPGVYRSGFPGRHNLTFLQRLGLRTLVRLEAAEYPPEVAAWIEEQGIRIVQCATTRNREPVVSMDQAVLLTALRALLDHQNHPVLVHGLRGQQRTGVVVGCLRRLQRWSLSPTFDEYRRHAATASSLLDLQQIELFDPSLSAPLTAHETLAESDGAETVVISAARYSSSFYHG